MHAAVRRLMRRLERAVRALSQSGRSTAEWSADSVSAVKRLVRAQQAALVVSDGATTRHFGDPGAVSVLRRTSTDAPPPAPPPEPSAAPGPLTRWGKSDELVGRVSTCMPTGGLAGYEAVGVMARRSEGGILAGLCCLFEQPLDRQRSADRLRLVRLLRPALEAGVHARLARRSVDGPAGRQALRSRFLLTERECDVAWQLHAGRTNLQISQALGISPSTARHHTERVLDKLGIRTRSAIHAAFIEAGIAAGGALRPMLLATAADRPVPLTLHVDAPADVAPTAVRPRFPRRAGPRAAGAGGRDAE